MKGDDLLAEELRLETKIVAPSRRIRHHLWIVRRVGFGLLTLFVISILVFAATQALPTDPAEAILGRSATPENVAELRAKLGLDEPVVQQYLDWLGGILHGDLGNSITSNVAVSKLIGDRFANSVLLLLIVAVIAIPLSVIWGSLSAIRRDRTADRAGLFLSFGLTALPEFVIGAVLVIVFSTVFLQVLPAVSLVPDGQSPLSDPEILVLPVATLVLVISPYLFRLMRGSMIDALESDYVQMARMKGLPERVVLGRHAFRNALVPMIQGSALSLAYLFGGVVVIEFLFAYPGLGSLLTEAINGRDMPVIQAVVLIFAAGVVVFNLLADVLTVYVTPRLRTTLG